MDKKNIKCYMHGDKVYVRNDGTLCHISTLSWGAIYIRDCQDQLFIPEDADFIITKRAAATTVPSAEAFVNDYNERVMKHNATSTE